jgi:hypothetical protein
MKIERSTDGLFKNERRQQEWITDCRGNEATAYFAGEMMQLRVQADHGGAFELHYLGYKSGAFQTTQKAKEAAPAFAKSVLLLKIGEVVPGYQHCHEAMMAV